MPEYKLTYFNIRGLGEPIRLILKLAGVPFEDKRIEFAEWPTLKETSEFPVGQMPVLLEDGKVLTQSVSISRYLARKYGFVSEDPFLNYRSDQVIDILEDARKQFTPLMREKVFGANDPQKVKEMTDDLVQNVFPRFFKQITSIIQETEGDLIAGKQLTVGDIFVATFMDMWEDFLDPNLLQGYPVLKATRDAVFNLPEIKAYMESRPKTVI